MTLSFSTGGEAGPSAKWYHAAFHNLTAVVGVGVLGLPYSFSYLGWYWGVIALAVTLAASLYTAYLLAALHEEPDGTRHNRYVDLGRAIIGTFCLSSIDIHINLTSQSQMQDVTLPSHAHHSACKSNSCLSAGDAWARWLITPLQYSVMIGLAVAYLVTAGQSFQVSLHMHDQSMRHVSQ